MSMKSLMLLYGASELGKALLTTFAKAKSSWKVLNIDSVLDPNSTNVYIDWTKSMGPQILSVEDKVRQFSDKYSCIISAGYQFVPTKFKDLQVFNSISALNSSCVLPALLASHLATAFLQENGLLMLHGSYQVLKDKYYEAPVFGTALNMVHGIGDFMANSGSLAKGARVITVAPDFAYGGETERKTENLLEPEAVAEEMYMWANADKGVPENGSFIGITGNKGIVIPEIL
eukprot:TRINITY_DN13726_c0_g1_i3.p1 TRINITY_DN13726_c0_g1~~TRINITY_DN13726_c0_g1_i3.p1  ORF type:complete len:231 (+),score=65.50 TRINITY_DN13726_c0_g1_i3:165-857(+)